MPLCFIGALLLRKDRKPSAILILLTIMGAFFAAFLHVFPMFQRMALYLIPFFILLAARPLDLLFGAGGKRKKTFGIVCLILFAVAFKTNSINHIQRLLLPERYNKGSFGILAEYLAQNADENDVVLTFSLGSCPNAPYRFYRKKIGLKLQEIELTKDAKTYPERVKNIYNTLDKLDRSKIYWAYFTYGTREKGDYILENYLEKNQDIVILQKLTLDFPRLIKFKFKN